MVRPPTFALRDGLLAKARHEDGVGCTNLDTQTMSERDISLLEVMGTPAEHHGVESHHECSEPGGFSTVEQRLSEVFGLGPGLYIILIVIHQ